MAEKKEHEHEASHKGKAKKKHLHQIITTRARDGSFSHDHIYKDHPEHPHSHPPVFAGTSQDVDDLKQHMEDHFGDGAQAAENEGEEPAGAQGEMQGEGEPGE